MAIIAFITPIADILSVISMEYSLHNLFYVSNTIYYLGQQWNAFLFFIYILAPLERRGSFDTVKRTIFYGPIGVITLLILINPFIPYLYTFDFETHTYSYGPLQLLCYFPVLMYYIYAIFYVFRKRDNYNPHLANAVYNTLFVLGMCVVIQALYPALLIHSFGIAVAMLGVLFSMCKDVSSEDPVTGMLDETSFRSEALSLVYNKMPFYVIQIRIADYEVLLSTFGYRLTEMLIQEICLSLKPIMPSQNGYLVDDCIIAMIVPYKTDYEKLEKRIDSLLQNKITIHGVDITFTYFINTICYPENFRTVDELLQYVVYFKKMHRLRYGIVPVSEFGIRNLARENAIEIALKKGIERNRFEIYYQPMCISNTQRFITSEALIRFTDPFLGPIGPAEFIPIAEQTGLIIPIGEFVIDDVCRFISENELEKLGVEYIEVNLSTVQILQRDFIPSLSKIVSKYNIKPSQLCFEITETAGNCAPEIFDSNLLYLHQHGYRLAIDDFGTGYGNLQRLISLDFDIVKFDKNTTAQICSDEKVKNQFGKMINLLHGLNCKVVSEGVETADQYEYLNGIDTDYIQGYYFAEPMDEIHYLEFLNSQ